MALLAALLSSASDLLVGAVLGAVVSGLVVGVARIRGPLKYITDRQFEDERFRVLFDSSSDAHLLYDEVGILECNQTAVEMLGCKSKDEVRRYKPGELSPEIQPNGRPSLEMGVEIEKFVDERGYHRFDWVHRRMDGTEFPVEVTLTKIELQGKRLTLGLWHDLTQQRQAESALKESQRKRMLHIQQTPLAVIEWDTNFRVTAWNPSAERIFGWTQSEAMGLHASFIIPESTQAEIEANWTELLANKKGSEKSGSENLKKDGEVIQCEWYNTVLVDSRNRVVGVASLVQDVTESRIAQLALADAAIEMERQNAQISTARDEALQSARAKSEFLANMSHEIRTPMNGVIGMTGLLLDSPLNEQQRDYVQTIRASGDALLTVINDILDFSKIESGKMTIESTDFNLRDVMEEVGDLLGSRAHEKGLEVIYSIPKDFPEELKGDSGRVRQVLTNLVSNALKFTDRGEVVIGATVLKKSKGRAKVRIFVRDTGIGIPLHRQKAIFDSFTQVDGSTTRKYGGTGLGLTISRQLTELMGGKIGVISEDGEGSEFYLELNLELQEGQAVGRQTESRLQGVRVLAVDDNDTNLYILQEQLKGWGCVVSGASSGDEALTRLLESAEEEPFGLIVMDMHMPHMNGEQTTASIKAMDAFKHIPVVLLTSMGNATNDDLTKSKGFVAALNKPVRRSLLFSTLNSAVGLDATLAVEPASEDQASMAAPLVGVRVLLAEDNVVNQKVALRVLEKFGASADCVANGLEAVFAVSNLPYDLVLMDCQMPEMDGYEATQEIRRLELGTVRHIPIVAMTANAMQGDREKCLDSGMDDYLAKPMKPQELLNVISEWIFGAKAA